MIVMGDSSGRGPGARPSSRLRGLAFFSLMGGFLLVPAMPVQFTSIITAIVWSLSGALPGVIFLIGGTFFRPDSLPILSGIQGITEKVLPSSGAVVAEM